MIDDAEFVNFILASIPAHQLKALYSQYQSAQDFSNWLEDMQRDPDLLKVLYRIWQLDREAKAKDESHVVKIKVIKRIKRPPQPITEAEIAAFEGFLDKC